MQAIVTRFLAPTDHADMRIKATCQAKTIIMPWQDDLNGDQNHGCAARLLQQQMRWIGPQYGRLHSGVMPNGDYAWVLVEEKA